jgi:S-methylmethionine-dependent homocysteine/selenocysteine methylase
MCEQTAFSVAATNAALEIGLPIWIGISAQAHKGCKSLSVFSHKELDFESLVQVLAGYPAMMMNIMHTPLPDVNKSMEIVKRYWDGPVGIYSESGYFTMPNWQFVDVIEPDELAKTSQTWIANDARMVGGCCGFGPEHISALRQVLN